jgi:hypothetical protein
VTGICRLDHTVSCSRFVQVVVSSSVICRACSTFRVLTFLPSRDSPGAANCGIRAMILLGAIVVMQLWPSWLVWSAMLCQLAYCFKITGVPGGMNNASIPRPFRLDINDLAQSGPAFDLYIQALNELQRTDQDDPLSYYQIAGGPLRNIRKDSDSPNRYTWLSGSTVGWCRRVRLQFSWLLYAWCHGIPDMASPLSCSVRGEVVSIQLKS